MKYHEQLKSILSAAGWSQEKLASVLGVSFATVNSWINEKSVPRNKAKQAIEKLFLDIVGSDTVSTDELDKLKSTAKRKKLTVDAVMKDSRLLNKLTLYLTYHTNTIEGSTMTLSDVEDVLFENKVLSNRTAIEQAEARNHQACLHWLLQKLKNEGRKFHIDEELICEINLRLMNGITSDAGQLRNHSVRILGSRVSLVNWQKIADSLNKLEKDLNDDSSDFINNITVTHAIFEKIHPFSDGNGRTGRLLMLAQALKLGYVPPLVLKERKYAYYKYLEIAQTTENYQPLEKFIAESIVSSSKILKLS